MANVYGTKNLVLANEEKSKNKLCALMDMNIRADSRAYADELPDEIKAEKCYCQKCQHVVDLPINIKKSQTDSRYAWNTYINFNMFQATVSGFDIEDATTGESLAKNTSMSSTTNVKCPDCGEESELEFVPRQTVRTANKNADDYDNSIQPGSWIMPKEVTGRYIFKHELEGKTTRIEDNTMYKDTIVFPSYKTYSMQTEISEATDFLKRNASVSLTKIHGDNRKLVNTFSAQDPYLYYKLEEQGIPRAHEILIRDARTTFGAIESGSCFCFGTFWNSHPEYKKMRDAQTSAADKKLKKEDKPTLTETIYKEKVDAIFSQIEDENGIFNDPVKTGLFNSQHHLGQDNAKEYMSNALIERYSLMTLKYPAAIDYVKERTNARILNYEFNEKRNKEKNPDYQIKDMPDSAKARMFREEMQYISEQLVSCDDKILKTIKDSKNAEDMKNKLSFFVFGENAKDVEIPKRLSVKSADELKTDSVQASKALRKEFNTNPIATASNIYTCHKLGIKEPSFIADFLKAAKDSPCSYGKNRKNKDTYKFDASKNADVMLPIHNRPMLRFIKEFSKTHAPKQVLGLYTDEKMRTLAECVSLYEPLARNENIKIVTNVKKNLTPEEKQERNNNLIKNYLTFHTIKEAYADFVTLCGKDTVERVNAAAHELQHERQMDTMKKRYEDSGVIPAEFAEKNPNAKEMLEEWEYTFNRPVTIATRDEKPLFEGRTISEIHNELAENLTKKNSGANTPIPYSQTEKDLEMSIPVPDEYRTEDMKPDAEWKIRLIPDTFGIIRTSSELHNCMGSITYEQSALSKRATYLRMEDENGHAIAAIELYPVRREGETKFAAQQFEANRDTAVPSKYAEFAWKWLNDNHIQATSNDCQHIGDDGYVFYGNGQTTDYHNQEIDDVTNCTVDVEKFKRIQKERRQVAEELYGVTTDGKINTPDVPDDLSEFA